MSEVIAPGPARVFASLSSYALGCAVGHRAATELLTEVCAKGARKNLPDWVEPYLPGARTINRLAHVFETTLRVDCGGTRIGVTRARNLYEAHKSPCDAWLSIDDDVETDERTLRWLIEAVAGPEPRVCIAPCLLREQQVINVLWSPIVVTRRLPEGGMARRCQHGGFGLVVMNRAALDLAVQDAPKFRDADGIMKPARFVEKYDPETMLWYGEDIAFFREVPGLQVEALITGVTVHAGQELQLEKANQ